MAKMVPKMTVLAIMTMTLVLENDQSQLQKFLKYALRYSNVFSS